MESAVTQEDADVTFTPVEVQKMISEALETKLSSFNTRMAAMMELMKSQGKEEEVEQIIKGEVTAEEVTKTSKKRVRQPPKVERVEYWDDLLKEVIQILNLDVPVIDPKEPPEKDESQPEDEEGGEETKARPSWYATKQHKSQILPMNESLKEVMEKRMAEYDPFKPLRMKAHLGLDYRWPNESFYNFSLPPKINEEFFQLKKREGAPDVDPNDPKSKVHCILGKTLSKVENLVHEIDRFLRTQTRVASHGQHFLDALEKSLSGESEVSKESLLNMVKGAKRCLVDMTDITAQTSLCTNTSRRYLWLDTLLMNEKKRKKLLVLPHKGEFLFSSDFKDALPELSTVVMKAFPNPIPLPPKPKNPAPAMPPAGSKKKGPLQGKKRPFPPQQGTFQPPQKMNKGFTQQANFKNQFNKGGPPGNRRNFGFDQGDSIMQHMQNEREELQMLRMAHKMKTQHYDTLYGGYNSGMGGGNFNRRFTSYANRKNTSFTNRNKSYMNQGNSGGSSSNYGSGGGSSFWSGGGSSFGGGVSGGSSYGDSGLDSKGGTSSNSSNQTSSFGGNSSSGYGGFASKSEGYAGNPSAFDAGGGSADEMFYQDTNFSSDTGFM